MVAVCTGAPYTVSSLRRDLDAGRAPADLGKTLEKWFSAKELSEGTGCKTEGLDVLWAYEPTKSGSKPNVVSLDGRFVIPMHQVNGSALFVAATHFREGMGFVWAIDQAGKRTLPRNLEVYSPNPENAVQPGVPKGVLTQQAPWKSKIFADTTRDWWVYIPADLDASQPAPVMIFQDGVWAKNYVPTTLDNLIAKHDIPAMVAIFVSPGMFANGNSNRSFEYDTLSDQYARFLLDEILPEVEKTVKLRHDPAGRAVAGLSSGGICSFTAAWERPNEFGRVMSWIGSFTNIAHGPSNKDGGHNYPAMIRLTPKKPFRVFLQDGSNDLDNPFGNWPLSNQQMAKALAFAGYDYKFVLGEGFHSDNHGRFILPDTLRWLWK